MLAPHESLYKKAKKALISQLGPFSYTALPPIKRIGPVQAARLYSSSCHARPNRNDFSAPL